MPENEKRIRCNHYRGIVNDESGAVPAAVSP